jgi:hypothetical protein
MFVVLVANNRRYTTRAARSSRGLFHGGGDVASVAVQARWAGRHRPRPAVAAQARAHGEQGRRGTPSAAQMAQARRPGSVRAAWAAGSKSFTRPASRASGEREELPLLARGGRQAGLARQVSSRGVVGGMETTGFLPTPKSPESCASLQE